MNKLSSWLALKYTPGIGNYLFKRLIDKFKSPEDVLSAPLPDLLQIEGISKKIATNICNNKNSDFIKKEIDLAINKKIKIITMQDHNYPKLLLTIDDPPPLIYVYGNVDLNLNNISVVGSRKATSYGINTTWDLCKNLYMNNFQIVSGMARGIDTAAHKSTISVNGKTIAVLGSGLGVIYPPENRKLFYQIAENGAVISEFSIMTQPEPYNFPIRNRIISGMSLGTIVVEAAFKSGSLITARLAAEQGREVFAVPGSINSFKSAGTHKLLKNGAKLVENINDIIEEFEHLLNFQQKNSQNKEHAQKNFTSEEKKVLKNLEPYPIHIDELARKVNMQSSKLSGILLQLEIKGVIIQSPGKLFYIKEEI